ncbi:MAG: DUF6364 family protein [bacterium]
MGNITMTLDDELIKRVKKIAVEQDTTLTGMIRGYLMDIARKDEQRTEEIIAELSELMNSNSSEVGPISWTRDQLHER